MLERWRYANKSSFIFSLVYIMMKILMFAYIVKMLKSVAMAIVAPFTQRLDSPNVEEVAQISNTIGIIA